MLFLKGTEVYIKFLFYLPWLFLKNDLIPWRILLFFIELLNTLPAWEQGKFSCTVLKNGIKFGDNTFFFLLFWSVSIFKSPGSKDLMQSRRMEKQLMTEKMVLYVSPNQIWRAILRVINSTGQYVLSKLTHNANTECVCSLMLGRQKNNKS